jgi:hypothetical protein
VPPPGACTADIAHRDTGGLPKRGHMRYSAIVMALSVMTAIVPQLPAQTQPATPAPPPAATQPPPKTQPAHPKANGAAKGAAIGAMGGNAAKGAVIGAGHSRREERRAKR